MDNKYCSQHVLWQYVCLFAHLEKTLKTRKLCYRKDVRMMHNTTIRTWFAARKSIRSLSCTGKNKAKMAISVAVEAEPEVEIWQ